jgi:hypothetical protein
MRDRMLAQAGAQAVGAEPTEREAAGSAGVAGYVAFPNFLSMSAEAPA